MNKELDTLVSVVMAVYNGEKYLAQSIESILNQTFQDFEFIIIDDGSKDNSLRIIKEYQYKDCRVKIKKNKENIGLPASLNKGLKIAKGKYIARQDADDISLSNRLEVQYNYMEDNSDVDILGSDNYYIDIGGNIFSENSIDEIDVTHLLLSKKTLFSHGTAFIRKSVFDDIGFYNESFFLSQDREYWMRSYMKNKKIHRLRKFLYKFRITESPRNQHEKKAIRNSLNKILMKSFRLGLKTGIYHIKTKEVRSILDRYNNKKNTDISGYWFFIARQAQKRRKKGHYVRQCLLKSLHSKDYFYHHILKIIFLVLSYFPLNYGSMKTTWIRKMWS